MTRALAGRTGFHLNEDLCFSNLVLPMRDHRLLVGPQAPFRRLVIGVFALGFLGGVGFLVYELGRYRAGYSLLDAQAERRDLRAQVAGLEQTNEALRRRIAVLETSTEVDQEAYAQVEANLGELQARIQSQEEELAFYRGIVSPADGVAGLKIQEFELLPTSAGATYLMRLVLVQAIKHDRRVSGVVRLNVHGERGGAGASLALAELVADGESGELAYSFRYFQDLERQLVLPEGFLPARVDLEILPQGRGSKAFTQSFDWAVTSG